MPKITITIVELIDHDGRVSNETLVDAGDVDSYNSSNYDDFISWKNEMSDSFGIDEIAESSFKRIIKIRKGTEFLTNLENIKPKLF